MREGGVQWCSGWAHWAWRAGVKVIKAISQGGTPCDGNEASRVSHTLFISTLFDSPLVPSFPVPTMFYKIYLYPYLTHSSNTPDVHMLFKGSPK